MMKLTMQLIVLLSATVGFSTVVPGASLAATTQTVCLDCHAAQQGRGGKPVREWQESIHARNGISCHDCHGGDPHDAANAMSPARGFLGSPRETAVPSFCGRCHVGIRDDYLASAHGRALGSGGPNCVTCHGSHRIDKVTLELINEATCSRCHPYQRAAAIKQAMQATEQQLVSIEREQQRQKGEGIDLESDEKRLFALKNRYHRLFHNVDVSRVQRESSELQVELSTLRQHLADTTARQERRKLAGAAVVGGLLVLVLLLFLLGRGYDRTGR